MATSDRSTTTTTRPYGGKAPDERRAERRQRILDAALEVFGTDGYAASTVDGLCKKAGIGPKHFYEQFDSREALLVAVYDQIIDEVATAVVRALDAAPSDLATRTSVGIDAFLHAYLDDPRVARIACIEVVGAGAGLEQRRRDALASFAQLVAADAAAAGIVRESTLADTITLALVGGANELVINWLLASTDTQPSRDHIAYALTQLFMAASTIEPPSTDR